MVVIKPSKQYDGSSETLEPIEFYDGPPPPAAKYSGHVKKMMVTKYKSGERKGQPRIVVVVEIGEGKFKGAGIFHSLSYQDPKGAQWTNQFLDALDGNTGEAREAFWHKGYEAGDDNGKGFRPIERFGKFRPGVNMPVEFVTRMGTDQNDEPQAQIARFVVAQKAEVEETEESDGLNEFTPDSDDDDSSDPWS